MADMDVDTIIIKEESIEISDSSSDELTIDQSPLNAKQKVQASRQYKSKIQSLIVQRDPSIRIILNNDLTPPYDCGFFCNIYKDNERLAVVLCKQCSRLLTISQNTEERQRIREHNLFRHCCYRQYLNPINNAGQSVVSTETPIIVSVASEATATGLSGPSTSSSSSSSLMTVNPILQPPKFKPNTKEEMVYLINSKSSEISFSEPYKSNLYGRLGVFRVIYRNFNVQRWILCGFCNDLDFQQKHECFIIPNALKRLQQLIMENSELIQQKIPKNNELAAIAREIYFLNMNIDCVMCIRCECVFHKKIELHDCVEEIEIITDAIPSSSSLTSLPKHSDNLIFPVQLSSSITGQIVIPTQTTVKPVISVVKTANLLQSQQKVLPTRTQPSTLKPPTTTTRTPSTETTTPPATAAPAITAAAPSSSSSSSASTAIFMNVQDSLNLEQEIAKCQLNFISESMIPVEKLEKCDFLNLLQMFVDIGANHGQIPIEKLLATKEELLIERAIIINSIKENIKMNLKKYKLSYSCDIWDDLNNDKTYLTLSGHYVDDAFELKSCVFGIIRFNVSIENDVLTKIYEILSEYTGLDLVKTRSFLNGSVIVINIAIDAATTTSSLNTDGIHILTCCGTTINAIAEEMLQTENTEIKSLCDQAINKAQKKDICESSNWDYKLKSLQQYTSELKISSLPSSLPSSSSASSNNPNDNEMIIDDINKHTYLAILNTFQQVLISISTNIRKYPTINAVYVNRKRLIDVLQIRPTDCNTVSKFKESTSELIHRKFHINKLYNIAVYLDPRFKSLKFMSQKEQRETVSMCKEMIIAAEKRKLNKTIIQTNDSEFVIECIDLDDNDERTKNSAGSSGISAKRKKPNNIIDDDDDFLDNDNYLSEYMDIDNQHNNGGKSAAVHHIDEKSIERQVEKELQIYSEIKLTTILHNVLKFWHTNKELKYMRNFARTILAIPAVASPNACTFSGALKLYAKNRLDLNEDDLEAWIMLNGNENDLLK